MSKESTTGSEIQEGRKDPSRFAAGDEVVYIPPDLLIGEKSEMVKHENLGVVTSVNDMFVFVKYIGNTGSQATNPEDLFWIKNRPDLLEILRNNNKQKYDT